MTPKIILAVIVTTVFLLSGCLPGKNGNDEAEVTPEDPCAEPSKFAYPPVDMKKTKTVLPMGLTAGEHVAPIDHQYYQSFDNTEPNIEVYAPADGKIISLQHMGAFGSGDASYYFDDYHVTLQHDCGLSSIFIHIDVLADKIKAEAPEKGSYVSVQIPVEAGETIGWYKSNVDYMVVDRNITTYVVNPESYASDDNRLHISDPFAYFNDEVRAILLAKALRQVEPRGGTIEYDIDGTLQGTWFQEGTGGWGGQDMNSYWKGHLAIIPDAYDPSHFIFSIGDLDGRAQQFGIITGDQKPDAVDTTSGLVKYELTDDTIMDGTQSWDNTTYTPNLRVENGSSVRATVLVELLSDQKLKLEVFPNKKADQVPGFSDQARVYVR